MDGLLAGPYDLPGGRCCGSARNADVGVPVARTFDRIVLTDPPSLEDFLSDAARGKRRPTDPTKRELYEGLSIYATVRQARRKALDLPILGAYIAAVLVPDEAPIRAARTIKGSRGHHTLWGDATDLLGYVVAVVTVEGETGGNTMAYELWDTASRNIVGDYETEGDALAVVHEVLRLDGRHAAETLLLAYEDGRGRTETVATGGALADRAEATGSRFLVSSATPALPSIATGGSDRGTPGGEDTDLGDRREA